MGKYEIVAVKTIEWTAQIEAESLEHAHELSKDWDSMDFEEVGTQTSCKWDLDIFNRGN